jgi:putative transcriptional regulator
MREVLVSVFRDERDVPQAFHVLPGVYLSMRPDDIAAPARERRLYAGFAGWMPGQLQGELERDTWYVLPASMDVIFRNDTRTLWRELVDKATNRVAMRREEMPRTFVAVANPISPGILVP